MARKAVQAARGWLTLERALTGAELNRLEVIVKQCVAQAHADVNETYQTQQGGTPFKNGKFPNDQECDRVVRRTERGRPMTLAQELGLLKHDAAFACVRTHLAKEFGENFSVEPRYQGTQGVVLTNKAQDSLVPDLVVHTLRNATDIQCVYEFKFPCYEKHKLSPMDAFGVRAQLESYQQISPRCPAALVTPQGLSQLGIDG